MHVLITGAAGFLGRHFAKHHLYRDDKVTAVDDLSSPYAKWPDEFPETLIVQDAERYLGDHRSSRYDRVYHFAAPVGGREKIEGDPLFNADSLRLDSALFRWAVKSRPGVIVYPSSSAVYPVSLQGMFPQALREGDFSLAFEDEHLPFPDEMYGFTKLVGEFLAWKAAKYGVNTLCIRPFSGYGEDQSPEYPMPSIIARVAAREDPLVIWGPGTQTRDFIHVDDVVGATIARLRSMDEGYHVMNIGSGTPWSFLHVAGMAVVIAGYAPEIVTLTDKPFGVMHRHCDPSEMLTYYQPTVNLDEGIKRMLDVYDRAAST